MIAFALEFLFYFLPILLEQKQIYLLKKKKTSLGGAHGWLNWLGV